MSKAMTYGVAANENRHGTPFGGNSIVTRGMLLCSLLLATTGCNHRIASEPTLDVCAMAHDTVAMYLDAPSQTPDKNAAPSAGACNFIVNAGQKDEVSVNVHVSTKAAFDASGQDFEQTLRVILAEAGQTYGPTPNVDLTDTAKMGIAYIREGSSSQVILSERGVLLEIVVRGMPRDRILDLSRNVWRALLVYKPVPPPRSARISA